MSQMRVTRSLGGLRPSRPTPVADFKAEFSRLFNGHELSGQSLVGEKQVPKPVARVMKKVAQGSDGGAQAFKLELKGKTGTAYVVIYDKAWKEEFYDIYNAAGKKLAAGTYAKGKLTWDE